MVDGCGCINVNKWYGGLSHKVKWWTEPNCMSHHKTVGYLWSKSTKSRCWTPFEIFCQRPFLGNGKVFRVSEIKGCLDYWHGRWNSKEWDPWFWKQKPLEKRPLKILNICFKYLPKQRFASRKQQTWRDMIEVYVSVNHYCYHSLILAGWLAPSTHIPSYLQADNSVHHVSFCQRKLT